MNKGLPVLLTMTILSGIALSSTIVSADTEVIDTVELTVPVACTMSGTGTTHTATLNPGTYSAASGSDYEAGIGKTTLTAICNDDNGFSIYAIGFTGNQYEGENHTKLVGTNTNGTIATKAYASGDTTSNWSMKLTKVTDTSESYNPQNLTISTGYDNWIAVPATYTKVAQYKANTGSSTTDTTLGVKLETTYAAYIASNQAADTYVGQVKYTMVHPYNKHPLEQDCEPGKICYYPNANDAIGTMGNYELTSLDKKDWYQCYDTDFVTTCWDNAYNIIDPSSLPDNDYYSPYLLASNFSRNGYGFAGWSDAYDYKTNTNAHLYGPQETITISEELAETGLSLYAVWVESEGSIQNPSTVSQVCDGLTQSGYNVAKTLESVSALTDQRDNQTYAIAKLADGNCWMIENLRLDSQYTSGSTNTSLAQHYNATFTGLADAESPLLFINTTNANSLYSIDGSTTNTISGSFQSYRFPRYNNDNTYTRATNPTSNIDTNLYSYGNYYTWAAAIADTSQYISGDYDTTSICPYGWHLPRGGDKSREASNEFWILIVEGINGGVAPDNYETNERPHYSNKTEKGPIWNRLRAFPNNFVLSGLGYNELLRARGLDGYYWTSTSDSNQNAKFFSIARYIYPGNNYSVKWSGRTIRCLVSSSQ